MHLSHVISDQQCSLWVDLRFVRRVARALGEMEEASLLLLVGGPAVVGTVRLLWRLLVSALTRRLLQCGRVHW